MKKFLFSELNDDAKSVAINNNRHIIMTDEWYLDIINEMTEKLEQIGYGNIQIGFALFGGAKDGASFTYGYIDRNSKTIQSLLFAGIQIPINDRQTLMNEISLSGIRQHDTVIHEKSITNNLEIYIDDWSEFCFETPSYSKYDEKELFDLIKENAIKTQQKLSEKIYVKLKTKHKALTSDSVVSETLIENETLFFQDGEETKQLPENRFYLVTDKSGSSAKPYEFSEVHIRQTWDLNDEDEDGEETLLDYLDNAYIGDTWTDGVNHFELIKDLN